MSTIYQGYHIPDALVAAARDIAPRARAALSEYVSARDGEAPAGAVDSARLAFSAAQFEFDAALRRDGYEFDRPNPNVGALFHHLDRTHGIRDVGVLRSWVTGSPGWADRGRPEKPEDERPRGRQAWDLTPRPSTD